MIKETSLDRLSSEKITTRASIVQIDSYNENDRTVEAVFSTEAPVVVFDWDSYRMIPEILLSSGMKFPSQVPMLDNHNRFSVKDQLGSGRNMRVENSETIGILNFANTPDSESALELVREKHLTDVSIGYTTTSVFIEDGESYTHEGRTYNGPLKLALETNIKEISLTPIGADEFAKIRSEDKPMTNKEIDEMKNTNKRLLTELENANSALKVITYNHNKGVSAWRFVSS